MNLKFGVHVSISNINFINQLINDLNVSILQFFISNPRTLTLPNIENLCKKINSILKIKSDILFCVHMPYVINLASNNYLLRSKSVAYVIEILKIISKLNYNNDYNIQYYILHPGSGKFDNLICSFNEIISHKKLFNNIKILIENTEGSGQKLFGNLKDIYDFFNYFDNDLIQLCWDTAHSYGAGIDTFKLPCDIYKKIKLVHLNDSKVYFSSHKDRHENFLNGLIGVDNIKKIIDFFGQQIPYIIERENVNDIISDLNIMNNF